MSTISLGKIRFNWKGEYDPAVSYEKNDCVKYGSSSYVCVANTTGNFNAAHWELMNEGLHPLTTRGDLMSVDANGVTKRIPKPDNQNKTLMMDANGDLVWGYLGGQVLQYKFDTEAGQHQMSYSNFGWGHFTNLSVTLNPKSDRSYFEVHMHCSIGYYLSHGGGGLTYRTLPAGGSWSSWKWIANDAVAGSNNRYSPTPHTHIHNDNDMGTMEETSLLLTSFPTTTQIEFRPAWKNYRNGGDNFWMNRARSNWENSDAQSWIHVQEIEKPR